LTADTGFDTEAARGAARAFTHGLDEVFAVVRPGNDRSIAVSARLSMEGLGRTSRYYRTELEVHRLRRLRDEDPGTDVSGG
jgi:RimJ/RimL family protein N-acetyltransferase